MESKNIEKEEKEEISKMVRTYLINLINSPIENSFPLIKNNKEIDKNKYENFYNEIEFKYEKKIIKVNFFKVLQQHSLNLCGFHSLFNIKHYIEYYKDFINSSENLLSNLNEMNNVFGFWSFHKHSVIEIVNNVYLEDKAKESIMKFEPMERYMYKYLIEKGSLKDLFKPTEEFHIDHEFMFFAYERFQDISKPQINSIIEKIENFRNSKKKFNLLVITLGCTNHWSVAILEKTKGIVNINYFDSKQIEEIFTYNNNLDLIDSFIERREMNKQKFGIKPSSKFGLELLKQWFKDSNKLIGIIDSLVYGEQSLEAIMFEDYVNNVNISLESIFYINLDNTSNFNQMQIDLSSIESMINWLYNYYHPKFLCNDVLEAFNNSTILKNLYNQKKLSQIEKFKNLVKFVEYIMKDKLTISLINENKVTKLKSYENLHRILEWVDYFIKRSKEVLMN